MRTWLRRFGLAEYGGDELLLATLACGALAWFQYVAVSPYLAWLALLPWMVVVWFFRDPERQAPEAPGVMISPADGTVMDICECDEPAFLGRRAQRVGIFLSPLNVHVNRAPCDGVVGYMQFKAGQFLPAYNPKAPTRNEALELGLETPEGLRVMVKQISGVLARRIVCEARMGEALARGARYGMIKFGSRTELYVPVDAGYRVEVQVGQKVRGGESVLLRAASHFSPPLLGEVPGERSEQHSLDVARDPFPKREGEN